MKVIYDRFKVIWSEFILKKFFLLISSELYVDISFVLGKYKSGLSSKYLTEYLTIPPIIEKRVITEKIYITSLYLFFILKLFVKI